MTEPMRQAAEERLRAQVEADFPDLPPEQKAEKVKLLRRKQLAQGKLLKAKCRRESRSVNPAR
jgi:hypothetical protein